MRLEIPCEPDRALTSNSRSQAHQYVRAKLVRETREDVAPLIATWMAELSTRDPFRERDEPFPLWYPVRLVWRIYIKNLKAPDVTNWMDALKPWEDELQEQGFLRNDNPKWVRGVSVELVVDRKKAPMTTLEVERCD